MAPWAGVCVAYGAVLVLAALWQPIPRRGRTVAAGAAYALIAAAAGSRAQPLWAALAVPGALLLTGYWLSGRFFRAPQPWLERWLLATDRRLLDGVALDGWLTGAPGWLLEGLETAYAAVHVLVAGGAIAAALAGGEELSRYWTLVLAAELPCYATLPWLRSRPPRAVESPGVIARRGPRARRLNEAILDHASVQANTLPSGHVAGATAAALATLALSPAAGGLLLAAAALIVVAAVAGRYHYVVDCVAGASLAIGCWLVI